MDDLAMATLKSHLLNFNSLITYLTSYYKEHINVAPETQQINTMQGGQNSLRKKEPLKRDEI